jgi:hypothetical protein
VTGYLDALVTRLRPEGAVAPLVRPADAADLALGPLGDLDGEETIPGDLGDAARAPGPPPGLDAGRPAPPGPAPSTVSPRPGPPAPAPPPIEARRSAPARPPADDGTAPRQGDDAEPRVVRPRPRDTPTTPSNDARRRVERIERVEHHTREVVREHVVERRADPPAPRAPAPLRPIVRPAPLGPAPTGGRGGPDGPTPAPDAAPTVHVRIGRIVVHGDVARPAPSRPAPAPVDHRSLADYLDGRDSS